MNENTKIKGDISEGMVLAHLLKQGYTVLIPYGENQRYDFVIDDSSQDKLLKIQVKTGRLVNGSVQCNTCSVNWKTHEKRSYFGEADLFYIYCPDTNEIYSIPVIEAPKNTLNLRVKPTRNDQAKGIRWAKDYKV